MNAQATSSPDPGSALSAVVAVQALRVRFPDGAVLLIGDAEKGWAAAELSVRAEGSAWRLEGSVPDSAPPKNQLKGVFICPAQSRSADRTGPVLEAEILVIEQSDTSTPIRWEQPSAKEETGKPDRSGTRWIHWGGAHLGVGLLPRNFLDTEALKKPAQVPQALDDALQAMRAMVRDLVAFEGAHAAPERAGGEEREKGRPVEEGKAVDPSAQLPRKDFVQRLYRLSHLLREGGVLAAWDALLADPQVLLTATHPVRPVERARRPVFSGSRGPWNLPGGWNPETELGRVRDRVVHRTADTPPNRLAVQLAARVRAILDELRPGLKEHFGYGEMLEDLRRRAVAVERAPVFEGVDRTAPVPLDSPSLQANRRCQPLLRAWTRLDRATRPSLDIPLDEVLLEPTKKTHHLYELWCTQRLRRIIEEATTTSSKDDLQESEWCSYRWTLPRGTLELAASLDPGQEEGEDDDNQPRLDGTRSWTNHIVTWALVSRPDGYLLLRPQGGHPVLIIWDAKYRQVIHSQNLSGLTYQAHAFRDALHLRDTDGSPPIAPRWSLVFHPTRKASQKVPRRLLFAVGGQPRPVQSDEDGTLTLDHLADDLKKDGALAGGIGILQVCPGEEEDDEPARELVRQLLKTLDRTEPRGRA
jgi:hypothetical protein